MQSTAPQKPTRRPCWRFDPMFADYSNEALYAALCAETTPFDAGLMELQLRMKPIIISVSRTYLNALSWTFDDAMGEALILLWDLIRKHSFKQVGAQFHTFFKCAFTNRLNGLFQQLVMKSPVLVADFKIAFKHDEPVYTCGYAFHPKGKIYREKKAAQQAAWREKKRIEQGKPKWEPKPPMTEEERREKKRLKSRERFLAMTPEEKRAQYDRNNERRRAKRAAMTPEEKKALNQRYYGYQKARKARQAAQAQA